MSLKPIFLNQYLSNEKRFFADNSRVEPTIFSIKKYHFLLNFSLANYIGNSLLRLSEVFSGTTSIVYKISL